MKGWGQGRCRGRGREVVLLHTLSLALFYFTYEVIRGEKLVYCVVDCLILLAYEGIVNGELLLDFAMK